MRVVVIDPPAPIVTWEEADQHLRLDGDDEQREMVERLVAAATGHIDGPNGWLGRALGPQTLEARMCGFSDYMCLPYRPIIDILSVHYLSIDGVPTPLDADDYELFDGILMPSWGKSWPFAFAYGGRSDTVRIRYRAGYATTPIADPPQPAVPPSSRTWKVKDWVPPAFTGAR